MQFSRYVEPGHKARLQEAPWSLREDSNAAQGRTGSLTTKQCAAGFPALPNHCALPRAERNGFNGGRSTGYQRCID